MQYLLENVLKEIIFEVKKCPDCFFDFDAFIKNININVTHVVKVINTSDFNAEKFFNENYDQLAQSEDALNQKIKLTSLDWFLAFIDHCFYLDILLKKQRKAFMVPSREAFNYKMNNDIRTPLSNSYLTDLILMQDIVD